MKTLQDAINELNVEYSEFNQIIRFKVRVYEELMKRYVLSIYESEYDPLDCWVGKMYLFPIKPHLFSIANHFAYRVALEIKESFDNIRQRYITEELDNDERK